MTDEELRLEWDRAHDVFCPRKQYCSTHLKPGDRIYFRGSVDDIPVFDDTVPVLLVGTPDEEFEYQEYRSKKDLAWLGCMICTFTALGMLMGAVLLWLWLIV